MMLRAHREVSLEGMAASRANRRLSAVSHRHRQLFAACDHSPAGRRDAAMLAILYGGGLRRAELCGLDLDDFDAAGCVITVRSGKGRRDRRVFLSKPACRLVKR